MRTNTLLNIILTVLSINSQAAFRLRANQIPSRIGSSVADSTWGVWFCPDRAHVIEPPDRFAGGVVQCGVQLPYLACSSRRANELPALSSFSLVGLQIGFLAGSLNADAVQPIGSSKRHQEFNPFSSLASFGKRQKDKKNKKKIRFFLCSSDHRRPHGVVLPVVVTCRRWNVRHGGCDCQLLLPPGGQQTAVRGKH